MTGDEHQILAELAALLLCDRDRSAALLPEAASLTGRPWQDFIDAVHALEDRDLVEYGSPRFSDTDGNVDWYRTSITPTREGYSALFQTSRHATSDGGS